MDKDTPLVADNAGRKALADSAKNQKEKQNKTFKNPDRPNRRKIRLIEANEKCRHRKIVL